MAETFSIKSGVNLSLTQTEIDNLTPKKGDLVYNSTIDYIQVYNGTIWVTLDGLNLDELFTIERDNEGNITKIISKYDLQVPPQSIEVGEAIKVSDLTQELGYKTKFDGRTYIIMNYEITDDGSVNPIVKKFSSPSSFDIQGLDDTTTTFTNSVSFPLVSNQDVIGKLYKLKALTTKPLRIRLFRIGESSYDENNPQLELLFPNETNFSNTITLQGEDTLIVDEIIQPEVTSLDGFDFELKPLTDFEDGAAYRLILSVEDSDIQIKGTTFIGGIFVPYVRREYGWRYTKELVAFKSDLTQDFTEPSSFTKSDLTLPRQDRNGLSILIKAKGDILNGQPVIWNYQNNKAFAVTPGALPSQHEVIGISLQTVLDGEDCEVLVYGFCTARRETTIIDDSETVLLNTTTTGTIRSLTNDTTFQDSGGGDKDYQNSENYSITFDAGSIYTVKITVNEFNFEHSISGVLYDRFGLQTSDDGINYSNVSIPWMIQSDDPTPPYSSTSGPTSNGYIFPKESVGLIGEVINTGKRYARFYFKSDSSTSDTGWDLTIEPNTPYPSMDKPIVPGSTLYLDNNYPSTYLNENSNSNILYGFVVSEDSSNDSVLMRIYKPKPIV